MAPDGDRKDAKTEKQHVSQLKNILIVTISVIRFISLATKANINSREKTQRDKF